jgi:hypothetical protein
MFESIADALDVSVALVQGALGLLLVQLAVQVWALVDLSRRRRVRFEKKWIWAIVIIFLGNSFIGPIIYAAVGRNVPQELVEEDRTTAATDGERTNRAVDTLYGSDSGR